MYFWGSSLIFYAASAKCYLLWYLHLRKCSQDLHNSEHHLKNCTLAAETSQLAKLESTKYGSRFLCLYRARRTHIPLDHERETKTSTSAAFTTTFSLHVHAIARIELAWSVCHLTAAAAAAATAFLKREQPLQVPFPQKERGYKICPDRQENKLEGSRAVS